MPSDPSGQCQNCRKDVTYTRYCTSRSELRIKVSRTHSKSEQNPEKLLYTLLLFRHSALSSFLYVPIEK